MNTLTRRSLIGVTTLVAAVGLTACGGDDGAAPSPAETATPPATATATAAVDPVMADLVGAGCATYAAQAPKGAGSFAGLANLPLATATRKNPLLTTLTSAISGKMNKKVKLVGTLNGGDYTVFAPVDAAFAKLPTATTANLKTDGLQLTKLLTHHVVTGRLSPKQVVGTQISVEGSQLKITGSGNALKVNGATVICGGIKTANATVYLIDTVLIPPR